MRRISLFSIIIPLLFSAAAGITLITETTANPETATILAMPHEQINYTITKINGNLFAIIDGKYPINVLPAENESQYCLPSELPMVYPTPPGTTNIHLKIDEIDLEWSNYPQATHHTAIGDWSMIYCLITPVPGHFLLEIHYEHPLERVNGSYIFLYDLNIGPYLSPSSPNSTANFNIRFDANIAELKAFTTETDEQWNAINYTIIKEDQTQVMLIQMYSEYSEPLLGDLAIIFSEKEKQELLTPFVITVAISVLASVLGLSLLVYFVKIIKRRHRELKKLTHSTSIPFHNKDT